MMKKSIVYLMIAAVVLTGLFMWGGNQGKVYATMGDNVTYTFPYLTSSSDKPVYCMLSNMTQDNATIHFYVLADTAVITTSTSQLSDVVGTSAYVYGYQTRMISFDTLSINLDGTSIGSLSGKVNASSNYSGSVRLTQVAAANYDGDGSNVVKWGNAQAVAWSCGNLPMACFQGTTSPKRNLVGYMCSDESMRRSLASTVATGASSSNALNKIYTY
ncbi:MAG: hypothetical protein H7843_07680 [Nitrospirota bacterium]